MRKNVFHSLHQGRRGWQVYIATIGLASLLFAPTGTIAIGQSDDELTDSQIKQILIRQSIASYSGSCPCPYSVDRGGRRCGGRSAYSRPGGASPLCYETDVTQAMVDAYRERESPINPTNHGRECPAGAPTWMGLPVCEEGVRVGYDRDTFGSAYSSLEDDIIDSLPKSGGQVYTPYICKLFDIRADGTATTDIEHIVALAEAYDSGLAESQFRIFAGDLDNLTIADPAVNRSQKSDRDAGEWEPPQNSGWFANRVVSVKQKYDLSVNPAERDALQSMLNSDPSRTVTCGGGLMETTPMADP